MSTLQLQKLAKIKEQIFKLNLTSDDITQFFAEIMDKISPPPKTLPKHIKKGIKESLENYKKGEYVVLEPGEEMTMENIRQKFKIKFAK